MTPRGNAGAGVLLAGVLAASLHAQLDWPGYGREMGAQRGTGDVPIKEVLQLLKRERYPIVADIEYDYGGAADPWNEVKKCFAYCKSALE